MLCNGKGMQGFILALGVPLRFIISLYDHIRGIEKRMLFWEFDLAVETGHILNQNNMIYYIIIFKIHQKQQCCYYE